MRYLIACILLGACTRIPDDSIVQITETVMKKDKGIDIEIKPIQKNKN